MKSRPTAAGILMPAWKTAPPKDESGYFDAMSRAIFAAGLNWKMVDKKWPAFTEAFAGFSPSKVAKLTTKDVQALMKNTGIVRNEKKIWATIHNANAMLELQKERGSMKSYIEGYVGKEKVLQEDLRRRFKFMGPSTTRMFLWMVGYPLTPTREEKSWLSSHPEHR